MIVEGNWLLLNETGWCDLMPICDYSIFITAEENMLKKRLIQRKIMGGTNPEKASEFYDKSDCANIMRALKNRFTSDCEIMLTNEGRYFELR